MKIKIVRQYDASLREVGHLTQVNWLRYAHQHGYGLETRYHTTPMLQANRMKLKAVHDAINPLEDWFFLFWADADSTVTRPERPLEDFCSSFLLKDFSLIFDVSKYGLSTGNFFVRNNLLAKRLLAIAIELGNVTEEVNRRYATLKPHEAGDESTLKLLIESFPDFSRHITTVKMADFPSTHTKDSFILHAAQRSEAERLELLSPYCQ